MLVSLKKVGLVEDKFGGNNMPAVLCSSLTA